MVAISRGLGHFVLLAGGLTGAGGARIARRHKDVETRFPTSNFIAGVPVLNYDSAYAGGPHQFDDSAHEDNRELDWNVVVKKGVTNVQIKALCKAMRNNCKLSGHPDEGGVPFLKVFGSEDDLKAAFEAVPGLAKFVEPDQALEYVPEMDGDPVPQPSAEAATWGLNRIGAPTRTSEGKGSNIYVVDSGIRYTHQEFGGRAFPSLDVTNEQVLECGDDLSCALDGQGHGTHCAGTIAGATFGVAPAAKVHGIKCMTNSGQGEFSWAAAGFDWVAARGARPAVVSMSLGARGQWAVLEVAVDAAVEAGVVVVVAAGNSIWDACSFSPASVPSAITVGSTNRFDLRSVFSNFGDCVDIFAPGSDVKSASHRTDTGSTYKSGTSMSCPHVAGGAALLQSEFPEATPAEVLETMLDRAETGAIGGLIVSVNKLLRIGARDGEQ